MCPFIQQILIELLCCFFFVREWLPMYFPARKQTFPTAIVILVPETFLVVGFIGMRNDPDKVSWPHTERYTQGKVQGTGDWMWKLGLQGYKSEWPVWE